MRFMLISVAFMGLLIVSCGDPLVNQLKNQHDFTEEEDGHRQLSEAAGNIVSMFITENQDYEVICDNGYVETVPYAAILANNVCPYAANQGQTPAIISIQRRPDGDYRVACVDGRTLVITLEDLLAGDACQPVEPPTQGIVVRDIKASGNGSCAIGEGGELRCWGENVEGRFSFPDDLTGVKDIELNDRNLCTIDENSHLRCWGNIGSETGRLVSLPEHQVIAAYVKRTSDNHDDFGCYVYTLENDEQHRVQCFGDLTGLNYIDGVLPNDFIAFASYRDGSREITIYYQTQVGDGRFAHPWSTNYGAQPTGSADFGRGRYEASKSLIYDGLFFAETCYHNYHPNRPSSNIIGCANNPNFRHSPNFFARAFVETRLYNTTVLPRVYSEAWIMARDNSVHCYGSRPDLCPAPAGSTQPSPVPELSPAIDIAAGYHHICRLSPEGKVLCMGNNDHGQLDVPTALSH